MSQVLRKNNYRNYRNGEILNIIIDCLNKGMDNKEIANHLNKRNIETLQGLPFTGVIVSVIKKRYIGCNYYVLPKTGDPVKHNDMDEQLLYDISSDKQSVVSDESVVLEDTVNFNNLPFDEINL